MKATYFSKKTGKKVKTVTDSIIIKYKGGKFDANVS